MVAGHIRTLHLHSAPDEFGGLQDALGRAGFAALCVGIDSLEQMRLRLAEAHWDALVIEVSREHASLAESVAAARGLASDLPIICAASAPTVDEAIAVMRSGAGAYVDQSDHPALVAALLREILIAGRDATATDRSQRKERLPCHDKLSKREMHQRLRGAEDTVRTLSRAVEQSPVSVVITNQDGLIEFVNPRFCQVTGYTYDEVVGLRPSVLKSGYTSDADYRVLWQTITVGGTWTGTFLNKKKNGDHYWEQASISPIRDESGAITHFVAVKEDITERKWSEDALRLSEAQYRFLAENSTDLISRLTPEGTVLYASPACRSVLGCASDEMVGRPVCDYWLQEDLGFSSEASPQQFAPLGVETFIHRARHRDGHLVWLETTMRSICDATTGSVIEVQTTSRDVTQQRKADLERERLAAIVESSSESIIGLSRSGTIVNWNKAATDLYGFDAKEAIGQHVGIIVPPERLGDLADINRRIESGAHVPQFNTVVLHKSGRRLDVAMTVSPVLDSEGNLIGSAGMSHDIGEELRAESALRKSEAQYRLLAENSTDLIARCAIDGEIHYVSPSSEALLGYTPESAIGRSITEYLHPDDLETLVLSATDILAGPGVGSRIHRLRRKDGTYGWFETTIRGVRSGPSRLIVEVQTASRDISARKQAEDALRESDDRFRRVIETSPVGFALVEPSGRLESVNEAFCSMFGHPREELIDGSFGILFAGDQQPEARRLLGEVLAGAHAGRGFWDLRRSDGSPISVLASMTAIDGAGGGKRLGMFFMDVTENEQLTKALRTSEARLHTVIAHAPIMLFALDKDGVLTLHDGGARFSVEADRQPAVGESVFDRYAGLPVLLETCRRGLAGETISTMLESGSSAFELWWTPEKNERGEVTGGTGLAVDVTATVHAQREAERARAAAVELAQLRTDFVAAVSHELRTPLTAIIGYGEMLQARWDVLSESDRLQRLGRIVLSANRQKRLVEDLLLLSQVDEGISPPKSAPTNVAGIARAVASETRTTYDDQYVDLDGADDLFALADRERAIQVLASVADNAAKYSPEGSPILIRWTAEGKNVVIRVFDAGSGIPDQGRERLFTRFGRIPGSRIRSGHVGTGLGLYMGKRLARAMDGDLDLEATGPEGSVFRLVLPLALD